LTDCVLFLHGHQPYYNEEFIVKEITWQSYGPMFKMLSDLSKDHQFAINLSLTGSVIQWFERTGNDFLISTLGELIDRGVVEVLLSPFYHAPFVFTDDGFIKEQFYHHRKMVKEMFGKEMRGLFPPELVFSTHKNHLLQELDIDYSIIDGVYSTFYSDDVEGLWKLKTEKEIFIIPRNRALSWHFSDNAFPNGQWMLETINKKNGPVAIGCDLECFGHHRGTDSFRFLEYFLTNAEKSNIQLARAEEVVKRHKKNAQLYQAEEVTTWARSINVFFPHSKIIEMWFARNDAVSTYHRIEYLYFKLENMLQKKISSNGTMELKKFLEQLIEIKVKKLDDIRWGIYRELTDAALYHEDFSNENTYRAMMDRCGWVKGRLWKVEEKLTEIMMKL
jgi:alpha-amylase/alpha-mannosidase (GH57 family)